MELTITARHTELTPAISDYVNKKLARIERHRMDIIWAQVILSVEKRRHSAEIIMHCPGNTYRTQSEAGDLYSAIDFVADKLDVLLKREKERLRSRREIKKIKATLKASQPHWDEPPRLGKMEPYNGEHKDVSENLKLLLEENTLENSLTKIQSQNLPVFPFLDRQTHRISVLYRKGKKKFGLLEVEE
jgi:putative sigma-54 modulation protein